MSAEVRAMSQGSRGGSYRPIVIADETLHSLLPTLPSLMPAVLPPSLRLLRLAAKLTQHNLSVHAVKYVLLFIPSFPPPPFIIFLFPLSLFFLFCFLVLFIFDYPFLFLPHFPLPILLILFFPRGQVSS